MTSIGIPMNLDQYFGGTVQKTFAIDEAKRALRRAYTRRRLRKVWAFLTRCSSRILDLHQVETTVSIRNRHYEGVRTVQIDHIRGSENRTRDFDMYFNPVRLYNEARWVNIATAILQGEFLPPVELIRVGETYFVRDGHHRVSAARALGQKEIDAVVTTWSVN